MSVIRPPTQQSVGNRRGCSSGLFGKICMVFRSDTSLMGGLESQIIRKMDGRTSTLGTSSPLLHWLTSLELLLFPQILLPLSELVGDLPEA